MKKKNNKTVLIAVIGIFAALVVYVWVSNLVIANSDRNMMSNGMMENMEGMMKSMSGMMEGMEEMHEECMKMMKGGDMMAKPEGMSQEEHESHHK